PESDRPNPTARQLPGGLPNDPVIFRSSDPSATEEPACPSYP
ncbi:MAG: hypothetical protein QOI75_3019, partial [Pseudonocardiales bacterium]|nr:hypothetical protein [Pseudonocardiales bacterium]